MKEEVPTVRRAKCMRIYDDDNHYYFYILGIYLPCGAGKGSNETSNRNQDNGSVLNTRKGTGSTLVYRGKTVQILQEPACFFLAPSKI